MRITDRGPFIDGRIIDLSHAAAKAIDLIGPGTARVRVEAVRIEAPLNVGLYGVQVGAFRDKGNAERLKKDLSHNYSPVEVFDPPRRI